MSHEPAEKGVLVELSTTLTTSAKRRCIGDLGMKQYWQQGQGKKPQHSSLNVQMSDLWNEAERGENTPLSLKRAFLWELGGNRHTPKMECEKGRILNTVLKVKKKKKNCEWGLEGKQHQRKKKKKTLSSIEKEKEQERQKKEAIWEWVLDSFGERRYSERSNI